MHSLSHMRCAADENRANVVAGGVLPPVLAALVTHAAYAGIVERAIGTLMNLSASGAGAHITVSCISCR